MHRVVRSVRENVARPVKQGLEKDAEMRGWDANKMSEMKDNATGVLALGSLGKTIKNASQYTPSSNMEGSIQGLKEFHANDYRGGKRTRKHRRSKKRKSKSRRHKRS